ncbi:MAG TPA: ionic transporter y4hA [Puia sp.]|jgi:Ca2+:H+ antiporter|nr:ionic transporter y4hA [Puia sp.]
MATPRRMLKWSNYVPFLSWIVYGLHYWIHSGIWLIPMVAGLIGSVLAAVHHAEVIAHRVGQPFGVLVLAIAVTVIEVALIVSLMFAGGDEGLARDTVFAAVMIILNGMMGLCLLIGGLKYRVQKFELEGVRSTLTVLVSISVLTLILPNYTSSASGPEYSNTQLLFVGIVTLVLYATFVIVQNIRNRDFFLSESEKKEEEAAAEHPPTRRETTVSFLLLLVCLLAVVIIAKALSPDLERLVDRMNAPHSLVGVIIAMIVLLPESVAAVRAARHDHLQKALNLSLGSAVASIGLTIPTVSAVSIITGMPIALGIDIKSTLLFFLTLLVVAISLSTGRTTILQGIVLLVLFAVYLFMIIFP